MKFLTRLFSPEIASKTVDGVIKGIDSAVYTKQEQAEMKVSLIKQRIDVLNALVPFKIMQRIMVTIIMVQWAFVGINMVIAIWVRAIWPKIDAVTPLMEFVQTQYMWLPVAGAVGLYLTGGLIAGKKKG